MLQPRYGAVSLLTTPLPREVWPNYTVRLLEHGQVPLYERVKRSLRRLTKRDYLRHYFSLFRLNDSIDALPGVFPKIHLRLSDVPSSRIVFRFCGVDNEHTLLC